jgi:hypothetical protein
LRTKLSVASLSHEVQCLKYAHGLIHDESRWTKNALARKANGKLCMWWDREATQFSLYGSLRRCCNIEADFFSVAGKVQNLIRERHGLDILSFNNDENTRYDDVVAIILDTMDSIQSTDRDEQIGSLLVTAEMKRDWKKDLESAIVLDNIEHVYYLGHWRAKQRLTFK